MADNNEISLSDSQTDSGIQTEARSIDEQNVEVSIISSPGAISTPVPIKINTREKELSLNDLFNLINNRFDMSNSDFNAINTKFDEQNNKFKELNKRFDSNEITLNEMKNDFNNKLDEQRIKFEQLNSQLQQSISVKFDGLINDIQEKNKCLENANEIKNSLNKVEQSTSNTNESCNGNVVLDKELTNNNDNVENNECNTENSSVFEELVSESDTVKINSENTDEFVECDYEMLMCVNELEREWKNSIVVEWGQRVNFLRGRMGGEGRPSRIYLSLIHI